MDQVDPQQLQARLDKANKASELFQRKQAELEEVNDRLRMENVQLSQRIDELSHEIQALNENLTELQRQNTATKLTIDSNLRTHSTQQLKSQVAMHEVTTLRQVKKELEQQLHASKSTTLSFQASFQAEFDLRSQIEQRLDELRERYERLIMENDQLRMLLKAHNITAPSPPGLRSMPGSRKKKHAPKARPMTMYSDLSIFAKDSRKTDNTENLKTHQAQLKKASSLKSLEEENKPRGSSQKVNGLSDPDQNGIAGETSIRVMAETAQIVTVNEDSSTTDKSLTEKSTDSEASYMESKGVKDKPNLEKEPTIDTSEGGAQQNGDGIKQPAVDKQEASEGDTLSPVVSSRTDTLMWNAKGFLNRIEGKLAISVNSDNKVKDCGELKPKSPVNDRDENELKHMMSSVSQKQLESAKAFLEVSQQRSSIEDLTADSLT